MGGGRIGVPMLCQWDASAGPAEEFQEGTSELP